MTLTVTLPDTPAPTPPPATRPAVLIVASGDGFLEVFASRGVRLHVCERLAVAQGNEAIADEYMRLQLPAWAKQLYRADRFAAVHCIKPQTVAQEAARVRDLDLVRAAADVAKGAPLRAKILPRKT